MKKKYIYTLLLCFILNGEALTDETKEVEITGNNSEITFKQYSDLLEMKYKDFENLLDAAEIEISSSDALFTKENQMKLVQFLQSFTNPEKTSGEIECRKDEMLFCQSERRISDGRSGRNKTADNVICQCGPINIPSW
jgi:alpha-glucosidase (family GH31 glycosyl hydrolase)